MKEIIAFLLHGENIKLRAYPDSGGVWTIGIGNTYYADGRKVKQGDTITREEAFKLAEFVATDFMLHVKKCVKVPLTANQLTALVSFTYNVGKPAFTKSILLKTININPNDPKIKDIFPISFITAGGVHSEGLVNRRNSEAAKYFQK